MVLASCPDQIVSVLHNIDTDEELTKSDRGNIGLFDIGSLVHIIVDGTELMGHSAHVVFSFRHDCAVDAAKQREETSEREHKSKTPNPRGTDGLDFPRWWSLYTNRHVAGFSATNNGTTTTWSGTEACHLLNVHRARFSCIEVQIAAATPRAKRPGVHAQDGGGTASRAQDSQRLRRKLVNASKGQMAEAIPVRGRKRTIAMQAENFVKPILCTWRLS
jgi:hypothetical protein